MERDANVLAQLQGSGIGAATVADVALSERKRSKITEGTDPENRQLWALKGDHK